MVRINAGQVYDWVLELIGVKHAPEPGSDAHEGLQYPRQWQPFDPGRDEPSA